MNDLTSRAIHEVLAASVVVETMKVVVPMNYLFELAVKLEAMAKGGGADSPFRERERDAVLREAGQIGPGIRPFSAAGNAP